jgi:hypothetical protein
MDEALAAHAFQPLELGQRVGVVVDAKIELRPVFVALDNERRPPRCRRNRRFQGPFA